MINITDIPFDTMSYDEARSLAERIAGEYEALDTEKRELGIIDGDLGLVVGEKEIPASLIKVKGIPLAKILEEGIPQLDERGQPKVRIDPLSREKIPLTVKAVYLEKVSTGDREIDALLEGLTFNKENSSGLFVAKSKLEPKPKGDMTTREYIDYRRAWGREHAHWTAFWRVWKAKRKSGKPSSNPKAEEAVEEAVSDDF